MGDIIIDGGIALPQDLARENTGNTSDMSNERIFIVEDERIIAIDLQTQTGTAWLMR
jgi:hypothetical protein